MIKAILIVLGAFTFWVFWRNFLWPWLYNQFLLWRFARILRKSAKRIAAINSPAAKEIADLIKKTADNVDEKRKLDKL